MFGSALSPRILPREHCDISKIPLKLYLQGKRTKYEVTFDYDCQKDTEKEVAEELIKALDLPKTHEKKIAKAIRSLLQDKILMIEMLMMGQSRRFDSGQQPLDSKKPCSSTPQDVDEDCEEPKSFNERLYDKLQLMRLKKNDYSFYLNSKKLFSNSLSKLKGINEEHINSRKEHLNGTVDDKYRATDINCNMFNIYDFHNSFTASSYLKHSFHSTFDKMNIDYNRHIDINSYMIDMALSYYDNQFYTHHEDIVEPEELAYSLENSDSYIDPNFSQQTPPFVDVNLSIIEHVAHQENIIL